MLKYANDVLNTWRTDRIIVLRRIFSFGVIIILLALVRTSPKVAIDMCINLPADNLIIVLDLEMIITKLIAALGGKRYHLVMYTSSPTFLHCSMFGMFTFIRVRCRVRSAYKFYTNFIL